MIQIVTTIVWFRLINRQIRAIKKLLIPKVQKRRIFKIFSPRPNKKLKLAKKRIEI